MAESRLVNDRSASDISPVASAKATADALAVKETPQVEAFARDKLAKAKGEWATAADCHTPDYAKADSAAWVSSR